MLRHSRFTTSSTARSKITSRTLWLILAALLFGCDSSPPQSKQNTVGGAAISSVDTTQMSQATTRLVVELNGKPRPGQFMIADILSYGGKTLAVTPPEGWTLLRDDGSISVRQSLFVHTVQASDAGPWTWVFSRPVDAQAVTVVLDNVSLEAPIDSTSGDAGTIGLTAKPVVTSSDGDLILVFFATDFQGAGLSAQLPDDMIEIAQQEAKPRQYWILGTYQSTKGETASVTCPTGQLYNSTAAQVAIRRASAPPSIEHQTPG